MKKLPVILALLLALLITPGRLAAESTAYPPEFEALFHASLDFYGKLQRTANGLYHDAYLPDQARPRSRICSTAATGVGLMALCMDQELGRDPLASQKALQTLLAVNGKAGRFRIDRDPTGYFRHFFSSDDGTGKSEFSTIDTAILVAGALYCRNTFTDPRITAEADELWNSIDWSAALATPDGSQLYMTMEGGKPREQSRTHLFNEYYLLAEFIRQSQIQKTGHSGIIPISSLPTWENHGLKLLCSGGPWPLGSFLIQFPFYMNHECATDPLYRQYMIAQAEADRRACFARYGVAEDWGCGAGGVPSGGYHADSYARNPENIISPHIIAGFMPVLPLAQENLLTLYRDPKRRVTTPVGDLLPRFCVTNPDWHPKTIESIDYSSMIFGLAGIHPRLGMKFFEEKTKFTFLPSTPSNH